MSDCDQEIFERHAENHRLLRSSPTPWTASAANFGQWSVGPADNVIAVTYSVGSNGRYASAEANAELIVKAVNNFEDALQHIEALLGLELGSAERALAFLDAVGNARSPND